MSGGKLLIDLDALARNYARLRQAAAPARCAAVVKANAYGLGVVPVARRLLAEGCRDFFVACAAEGLELRAAIPESAIYVFNGPTAGGESEFVEASLIPVLNTLEQVRAWAMTGRPAALNVDTGMTRLGLSAADVDALAADAELLGALSIVYLMTHLACADEPSREMNAEQLRRFGVLHAKLPAAKTSIGNSAASLIGGRWCGDLVRLGIALYGGNPFVARAAPIEPVATLLGRVIQLRDIAEPSTVGYGATYEIQPPARVALLGVGYADGYPRSLGNVGIASVGGVRVPVVGRVSMDSLCLDVSALGSDDIEVGQWVELFGAEIGIDELAEAAGTISYELLTGLGSRIEREYVGGA